jgi:hypothetical protein
MTPCHAGTASLCIGGEATEFWIDNVLTNAPERVFLCGPCTAAATRLGMSPRADRRRVPRIPVATDAFVPEARVVPEWLSRGLVGLNRASDRTGLA